MKHKFAVLNGGKQSDAAPYIDEVQTPSVITALHVQDVETSKVAGAPRAWRRLSQVENAFRLGRLGDLKSKEARDRLGAGAFFSKLWDCAQAAGRDSTLAFDFRGGGQRVPLGEAQRAAISRLVAIEMRLGRVDRTIIRAVCALGNTPAEAMIAARLRIETHTTARLCEALDALLDAIECTEKRGRK